MDYFQKEKIKFHKESLEYWGKEIEEKKNSMEEIKNAEYPLTSTKEEKESILEFLEEYLIRRQLQTSKK